MERFVMELPLEDELFTAVRLATGGLCALALMDLDQSEDFKVGVNESLLILKRNGFTHAKTAFALDGTLAFEAVGVGTPNAKEDSFESEISSALLRALLPEVDFTQDDDGRVCKITF